MCALQLGKQQRNVQILQLHVYMHGEFPILPTPISPTNQLSVPFYLQVLNGNN